MGEFIDGTNEQESVVLKFLGVFGHKWESEDGRFVIDSCCRLCQSVLYCALRLVLVLGPRATQRQWGQAERCSAAN
jgi:hypothetical protein